MKLPNKLLSTFDKILLGLSGCGMVIICALVGVFAYLWQNPPAAPPLSWPTGTSTPSTLLPTLTAPAPWFPTATLMPTSAQVNLPTAVPSPTPGFEYGANLSGKIVFTCFVKKIDQICLMNSDGSGRKQITNLAATAFYASLSPDGKTIYFSSSLNGSFDIYSVPVNGGKVKRLTKGLGSLYAPELSPDGQQIVFTHESLPKAGIWIMSSSGDHPHAITDQNDIDPAWSPDGSMISFASDRPGSRQLFTMNADGSNIRQVTNVPNMGGRSTWSPDGTRLAFYAGTTDHHDIYSIKVDGSGLAQLTNAGDNLGPSWSPDGNWIAFTSFRDGNNEIYIMHPDGTGQTRLTNNAISDWQPRWGK